MATTTKANRAIELRDIGAISELSIPLPEGGGVTVLRGFSGVGKSTALSAVRALTGGNGDITKRDGALKGQASGLGVTVTVQRATRRKGEAEITSIDGKLSISDLIDPKLKDPVAADAKRIKALVSIAADDPGPELFYDLAQSPEEFGAIVADELLDCPDVLSRAQRVKRCFEKAARESEAAADKLTGKIERLTEDLKPLEGTEIPDVDAIQQRLDELLRESGQQGAKLDAAEKARQDAMLAKRKLAALDTTGQSVEHLRAEEESRRSAYARAHVEVTAAERALLEAQQRLEMAMAAESAARTALEDTSNILKNAEQRDALLSQLREQIAAAEAVKAPSAEEVKRTEWELVGAREELQRALSMQSLAAKRPELDALTEERQFCLKDADRFRQAAAGAEGKLSQLVAGVDGLLQVNEGRLTTQTNRGTTYFNDLSDGERCRMALQLVLPRLGPNDLVTLDQPLWEGLPPKVQREVADEARRLRINVVTAQCSDDEQIRAEVL